MLGVITSSSFFVPQVNLPGSMASFIPPAIPIHAIVTNGGKTTQQLCGLGQVCDPNDPLCGLGPDWYQLLYPPVGPKGVPQTPLELLRAVHCGRYPYFSGNFPGAALPAAPGYPFAQFLARTESATSKGSHGRSD